MRFVDRTGETIENNQGLIMKIIRYGNNRDIDVEFEDGFVVKNRIYQDFKKGEIKNLYYPEVYGVGYIGSGEYNSGVNGRQTEEYQKWSHMLTRAYNPYYINKYPTYKDAIVCSEWHNFQNFAKFYNENVWSEDCTYLDKDILIKNNKVYSPETCILVDNRINVLFIKSDSKRGKLPIGVSYHKSSGSYVAQCNEEGFRKHLGCFTTPLEAFLAYKSFKENYIKEVADEYFEKYPKFPYKLLQAMYEYEVSIND